MLRFQRFACRPGSIGLLCLAFLISGGQARGGDHHGRTYEAIQGYTLQQATFATVAASPTMASGQQATALKSAPVMAASPAPAQALTMGSVPMVPMTLIPMQAVAASPVVAAPAPAPVQVVPVMYTMQAVAAPVVSTTSTFLVATPVQVLIPQAKKCGPFCFGKHRH